MLNLNIFSTEIDVFTSESFKIISENHKYFLKLLGLECISLLLCINYHRWLHKQCIKIGNPPLHYL
jgi:hypothetical protein